MVPSIALIGLMASNGIFINEMGDDPEALEAGRVLKATGAPHVIYSNFSDGTTVLIKGAENAVTNHSGFCSANPYPAWSGTEAQKKSHQAYMQTMMQDFNVVLAAQRPQKGPYSMIMIGPSSTTCNSPGAEGVADLDCGNKNPSNIVFNFSKTGSPITMGQEIAHSFGLSHVDVACDVMGAGYSSKRCTSGKWGYPDEEGATIAGPICTARQNSYQMMLKALGAWPGGSKPDPMGDGTLCTEKDPPTVSITEPADGANVGSDFTVKAEGTDDCGINKAHIAVMPQNLENDLTTAPFAWDLKGISGKQTITVTVTDDSGKTATASITVNAGGGGSGGSGGSGASGGQGGEGGGDGSGAAGDTGGCGCGLGGGAPVSLGALAFAGLLALVSRRRR